MRTGPAGLLLLLSLVAAGCNNESLSPLGPTVPGSGAAGAPLDQTALQPWSPYIGVHVTGEALAAYQDALVRLLQAGRLRGVRVELTRQHLAAGDRVVHAIAEMGLELLGLISNEFLFDQDIEGTIDRIFAGYPEIRYFQVGNEITTILPASGPTMGIEHYMTVFQRIYDHVQQRYPGRAILLTQSTLGSGLYGPQELERMAALGLASMDPGRVILAINDYDPHEAGNYAGLLGSTLRRFRVWVTEAGVPDPNLHTAFVRDGYPQLRNYLRAERIYWYVLWGGDAGSDTDFSLIKSPQSSPDYWKSPLFRMLTQLQ
jgi:hypothetical protein